MDDADYEAVRELAVFLKKQGVSPRDLASDNRMLNYIKKLGANHDQIESLVANNLVGANSPEK